MHNYADNTTMGPEEYETNMTLANAIQLGSMIIKKVAGNESSTTLGGDHLNQIEISDLLAAKIKLHLTSTSKLMEEAL